MGCGCSSQLAPDKELIFTREQLRELYQKSVLVNDGRLIVTGLLHRANSVNNNRRVYPRKILRREVKRYQRTHMRSCTALGELDHPSYVSPTFRSLNIGNISHQVLDIHWQGNNLMGAIEVLPTPAGKILIDLFKSGCQVGVSSRGWASLREQNGCITIQDDFELITFDFVTEPSTQGAFMQPTELKFRNIPDQTAVIQLAYAAYSLGQQKPTQQPRGPAPLQPAVLPMDRSLRSALQSLYTQLDHQYVRSIPTGPVNIHEAISHQLDGEDAPNSDINATLPPHPTKLKRDGTPRGSPKRDSCTRPVETSARRLPSRPAQPGPCTTQPQQDVLPNMVPEVPS